MRLHLLKTILWLRWRLSANQTARAAGWLKVLIVLITVLAAVLLVAIAVGGFFLGSLGFPKMNPGTRMLVIDGLVVGFLIFWMIGLMSDIQRSESIDLQRLLHLPVTLKDAFVVNYIASHFSLSLLFFLPLLLGVTAGLVTAVSIRYLVLLLLFLAMLFAVSSWTYCLRGWLVQLMVNPRRRRTIIITVTMTVILFFQLPNLFFNVYLPRAGKDGDTRRVWQERMKHARTILTHAHYYVPPLWVGMGTTRAVDGNPLPAAGAVLLFGVLGWAGLGRAYRSTLRFYRGESNARLKTARPAAAAVGNSPARNDLERDLPGVPGDVSVAALAFWKTMVRAPEMKMAVIGPIIMVVVFGGLFLGRNFASDKPVAGPLMAIGISIFALSGLMQVVFNQFGWDRNGFRALVLSPMERHRMLLAKNLALFPFIGGIGGVMVVGMNLFLKAGFVAVLAGLFQIATGVLILILVGNYFSITLPYRINVGSLKPTKMPARNVFIMMGVTLMFPIFMLPACLGPLLGMLANFSGVPWAGWLNLGVSLVMFLVVAVLGVLSLKPLGRLMQQREMRILETVTQEVE